MTLSFDLYWSMRSPFCYLALDRVLALRAHFDVAVNLRIVYPVAIRNPDFFKTAPTHYRSYHLRDSNRVAEFLGIAYRRPIPDPIEQDLETSEIAQNQPFIHQLTCLAAAAVEAGKGKISMSAWTTAGQIAPRSLGAGQDQAASGFF